MSSTFPIEDVFNIPLDFTVAYDIPAAGSQLVLRFGATGEVAIISRPSSIQIQDVGGLVSDVFIVVSENSKISVQGQESTVDEFIDIVPENSFIQLQIKNSLVEHLPEIEIASSKIHIKTQESDVSGGRKNDLPGYVNTGAIRMLWETTKAPVEVSKKQVWDSPTDLCIKEKIAWENATIKNNEVLSKYILKMSQIDFKNKGVFSDFKEQVDASKESSFLGIMDFVDLFFTYNWETFVLRDKRTIFPYDWFKYYEFKDSHRAVVFDTSLFWDKTFKNKFHNHINNSRDEHHGTFWGPYWYSLWCQEVYFPYTPEEQVEIVLKTDVPLMHNPEFVHPNNPRCPFDYWYTGGRDSYEPVIDPITQKIVPIKRMYYMLNTAYIKRLPDNVDVPFSALSLSIDRDDYAWSFSIEISSQEALEMIKPTGNVFVDIQIHINGWEWTCKVENWKDTSSLLGSSWTVEGRSPSIEIGDPYQVDPLYQNPEAHGGQIITDILTNTGWSFDWLYKGFNPFTQWMIPADKINKTDSSKIEQIRELTDSVHAYIQTVPDTYQEKKLIITPRFKESPWHWNTSEPDVIMNKHICLETSRTNKIIPNINAVIVSSDNRGIIVNAVKNGTAGDSPSQLIVNPYVTTQEAGREVARHVMGDSGFWIKHTYSLFSLMPPSEAPGLLTPGTMIQMQEVTGDWSGQVTGVEISAGWSDAEGLVVNQNIEVEQYDG